VILAIQFLRSFLVPALMVVGSSGPPM
jgi:hypothetical protein